MPRDKSKLVVWLVILVVVGGIAAAKAYYTWVDGSEFGESCIEDHDCLGTGSFCVRGEYGTRYCSRACDGPDDCPPSFTCEEIAWVRDDSDRATDGTACVPAPE